MKLYICEKPSQGRDLAEVLGVTQRDKSFLRVKDGAVTWAFGHLLELASPDHYNPDWKPWKMQSLPIFPDLFEMLVKDECKAQLHVIRALMREATEVVIATDADREGESIAREILDNLKWKGLITRLWFTGLDPESIRKSLASPRTDAQTRNLYHSAQGRSRADWLVGMNLTRATSLRFGSAVNGKRQVLNIGRVQTPTFALVVKRDREIAGFKSRDYFELEIDVQSASGQQVKLSHAPKEEHRIWEKEQAESIAAKVTGLPVTLDVSLEPKRTPPPALFDLTSLQKWANQSQGWSADKTLKVIQALYETHKVATYPRSDCSFLPEEQIGDVPSIAGQLCSFLTVKLPGDPVVRKTVFNSKKVTAHHAIIPTKALGNVASLRGDDATLFNAIARRYLAALYPDYEYDQTVIKTSAAGVLFGIRGNITTNPGWHVIWPVESKETTLPPVKNGEKGNIAQCSVLTKKTKPPSPYTEASLIEDMENVAKFVDDPRLAKILKGKEKAGIGTVATRAAIIEGLKRNDFLAEMKKQIRSTPKSQGLYDILAAKMPSLIDPAETAIWEDQLEDVEAGTANVETFLDGIRSTIMGHLQTIGLEPVANPATSERKESILTSFHPQHDGEPILEDEKSWLCPGFGRIPKEAFNRDISWDEWRDILIQGKSETPLNFISSKGKPYEAFLCYTGQDPKWKSPKLELEFPPRTDTPKKTTGFPSSKSPPSSGGKFKFPKFTN